MSQTRRAHYFQHVPYEGPAAIKDWLVKQHYQVNSSHFYGDWQLPEVDNIDLLVVMGGPMSVNDEAHYPWLRAEKQFIAEMIKAGKPILGICLGAQLIASAMGARVYANAEREIGWWPVTAIDADASALTLPASLTVLHWHGETFDLPAGSKLLASSKACINQVFQSGKNIIGVQFHLESTQHSVDAIMQQSRDDLRPDRWVQTEQEILAGFSKHSSQNHQALHHILSYLTKV